MTDLNIVSHNIGRSREALLGIVNHLRQHKSQIALIQEAGDDVDIAAEIRSTAAHNKYKLHYHKPQSQHGIAIITHESLKVKQIITYPNIEIIAVRVKLDESTHQHTLLVSVRCPHGVDNIPATPRTKKMQDTAIRVRNVYDTLLELTTKFKQDHIIIGGDFNETLLPEDRSPERKHHKQTTYLADFLQEACLIDVGGLKRGPSRFTYEKGGHKSRIDYLLLSQSIKTFDMAIKPHIIEHIDHKMLSLHIPHMVLAEPSMELREQFIKHWDINRISRRRRTHLMQVIRQELKNHADDWQEDIILASRESRLLAVEKHTESFNKLMTQNISAILTCKSHKTYDTLPLEKQNEIPRKIRTLIRLREAIEKRVLQPSYTDWDVYADTQLRSLVKNAVAAGLVQPTAASWSKANLVEWLITDANTTLSDLKYRRKQVVKQLIPKHLQTNHLFYTDRNAFYTRTFGQKQTERVTSIDTKEGKTLKGPDAVAAVRQSVMRTFGDARTKPDEHIEWVRSMYDVHKQNINPNIYKELMANPTRDEVWRVITYTENGKSGLDGISNDLLKALIKDEEEMYGDSVLLDIIHLLVQGIILTGVMPTCLKRVAMKMIPKSNQKPEPESMRPISIIPELAKITSKLLAKRLLDILTLHPEILHRSQRGFLRTGNIGQCIDALIDILEDNKQHKRHVHLASYDQKKAYDSVQHYSIKMSLERLNLPPPFISYVMSSITGSNAFLVTDMGSSETFPLLTSVKQGDPLAPLIFLFVVDPLHVGLERNPLHKNRTDGYTMKNGTTISSIAFADDFTVISNTWAGLERMHEWVRAFFAYHHMDFNADKSFYTHAIAKKDDAEQRKTLPGLRKDVTIPFRSPTEAWRHLGLRLTLDLNWETQKTHMRTTINLFRVNVRVNRLDLMQTCVATREYLIPHLDIGLTHARFVKDELKLWDRWIRNCVLSKSSIMGKRSFSKDAFHIITGIPSLIDQRDVRQVSELYIRLASRDPPSSLTLESRLLSLHKSADKVFPLIQQPLTGWSKYWVENAMIALSKLNMNIDKNVNTWRQNSISIFDEKTTFSLIVWQQSVHNPNTNPSFLFQATNATNTPWLAYTDGSTPVQEGGPSGIGVVMYHPMYEPVRVSQAFKASGNNFAAELMAILVALRITPINHPIQIYTDSQACVYVMKKELTFQSERQWIRTAARPIVRSIWKVLAHRTAPTTVEWVPSHSDDDTIEAARNREADALANRAREDALRRNDPLPEFTHNEEQVIARITPTQIDDGEGKHKQSRHIPGDIREEAKRECTRRRLERWINSDSGRLARANPIDTLELCRIIRAKNNARLLDCYLQTLTCTADTYTRRCQIKVQNKAHTRRLLNENCVFCNAIPESIQHIFSCEHVRTKYHPDIVSLRKLCDPLDLLSGHLQWFEANEHKSSLTEKWMQTFKNENASQEETKKMLTKIENHDRLAGMLGILPPGVSEVLFRYHSAASTTTLSDAEIKNLRKAISSQVENIRNQCIQLTFKIWTDWRKTKTRLLQVQDARVKLERKMTAQHNKLKKQQGRQKKKTSNKRKTRKNEPEPDEGTQNRIYRREYRPSTGKRACVTQKRTSQTARKRPTGRDHARPKKRRGKSWLAPIQ